MRKAWLFAPMLMLLLTACGGGGEKDQAAALQQQYAAVSAATLEADVTCSYEGEERTYTLLCAYTPEKSVITVLAPENLTGISATLEGETLTLSYDDISLDAGSYSSNLQADTGDSGQNLLAGCTVLPLRDGDRAVFDALTAR